MTEWTLEKWKSNISAKIDVLEWNHTTEYQTTAAVEKEQVRFMNIFYKDNLRLHLGSNPQNSEYIREFRKQSILTKIYFFVLGVNVAGCGCPNSKWYSMDVMGVGVNLWKFWSRFP